MEFNASLFLCCRGFSTSEKGRNTESMMFSPSKTEIDAVLKNINVFID